MTTARRRTKATSVLGRGWQELPEEYDPIPADIEGAMRDLGIRVTDVDTAEVKGHCPGHKINTGHEDRNPSWSVNLDTGTHFCFSCGYGGSFVGLTYDVLSNFGDDQDFEWRHARLWVIDKGVDLDRALDLPEFREREDRHSMEVIPETELSPFGPPTDEALEARNLSMESCRRYGVRFARGRKEFILPVRNATTGDLMGWQTKPLNRARHPLNVPKTMKKSKTLFGIDRMPVGCTPVLVESPLDCCRLFDVYRGKGYWGVASMGAVVSEVQMRLLRDTCDEVILALDNDADGKKYSEQIKESWEGRINLSFMNYNAIPTYRKDIGDMTDEEVRTCVDSAIHSTLYIVI